MRPDISKQEPKVDQTVLKPSQPLPTVETTKASAKAEVKSETIAALGNLAKVVKDFTGEVREKGHDFATTDTNIEQDQAFIIARDGMEAFIKEQLEANPTIPDDFTKPWIAAVTKFMVNEIAFYNGRIGEMNSDKARDAVRILKDPQALSPGVQNGIGPLKEWLAHSPLAADYADWEKTKVLGARKESARDAVNAAKTKLGEAAAYPGIEKQFAALSAALEASKNADEINVVTTKIAAIVTTATSLTKVYADIKNLRDRANALPPAPQSKEALELITTVEAQAKDSDGTNIEDLTTKLKEAQEKVAAAEGKESAKPVEDIVEEKPLVDTMLGFAEKMPDSSKFKKPLMGITMGLMGIFVTFQKAIKPLIDMWNNSAPAGWKINMGTIGVSNKLLWERNKDAMSGSLYFVESELSKFGLPGIRMTADYAQMSTKEFIKLLTEKPKDVLKDDKYQGRLAKLAEQLQKNGGGESELSVVAFLNDTTKWNPALIERKPKEVPKPSEAPAPTPAAPSAPTAETKAPEAPAAAPAKPADAAKPTEAPKAETPPPAEAK